MKSFVIAMVCIYVIGSLSALIRLLGDYPRTASYGVGFDCASLIINLALVAWAAYVLAN